MNTPPELPPVISPRRVITYEITRWDLFTNFLTIFLRNRVIQVLLLAALIFNGWLTLGPSLTTRPFSSTVFEAAAFILVFVGVLVSFQTIIGLATAFLLKQRGVVGQHTLEIAEHGLIERTEFNETLHKWPSIGRIISVCGYL